MYLLPLPEVEMPLTEGNIMEEEAQGCSGCSAVPCVGEGAEMSEQESISGTAEY